MAGRTPLSREVVLDAAIALVDAEGQQALTMRRLASSLGVEAMSLYNHVANKQDILDGMAALLIARMGPWTFDEGASWQEVTRGTCVTYREVIHRHPNVFAAHGGRPLMGGDDREAFDRLNALLVRAGFPQDLALDVFQVGSTFTHGFALSEVAYRDVARAVPDAWDSERAFGRGLDAIITGFTAQLAAPQ